MNKPVYNHETGEIEGPVSFSTKKILILEGLHTLYSPGLRSLLDFSLFVDPEPAVKYEWKTRRDMERRGYTAGEVQDEIERRREDYERFHRATEGVCRRGHRDPTFEVWERNRDHSGGVPGHALPGPDRIIGVGEGKPERIVGRHTESTSTSPGSLPLETGTFSWSTGSLKVRNRIIGALTFDGELDHGSVRRLEAAIERQTGIPIEIFGNRPSVTPGDLIELILAWRIINRRILIGTNFCEMDGKK